MTLRAWIDKLLGRQPPTEPPPEPPPEPSPVRGLDEPVIHGPEEEEAAAAKDRAADRNERLRKRAEDRRATPPDPQNP
jgi:hypothetical protein